MLTFLTFLLIFIYFKIARVHKKEEGKDKIIYIQHLIVLFLAILFYYTILSSGSYVAVIVDSIISFIAAGLAITAVQVGIFVDGKPFIGLSKIYKFLPILTFAIALLVLLQLA